MKTIVRNIIVVVFTNSIFAQLPECIKEKCDSILIDELGSKVFNNCISFHSFENSQKLNFLTHSPCETGERHSYFVRYKFNFPNKENASFNLGFYCSIYSGKLHVQSEYFYRDNQSDLPNKFRKKGLKIKDYLKIEKKAFEIDKYLKEKGTLILFQDKICWAFSRREPLENPNGIGCQTVINHLLLINPYNGKIVDKVIRTE